MAPPLVAVPAYPVLDQRRIERFSDDAVVVPVTYIRALRRAGALEAILLPAPLDDVDTGGGGFADRRRRSPKLARATSGASEILDRYDGLMLLGGGDLEPEIYGQARHETVYETHRERDDCELALTRGAIERGMPVLAICRGHQVLNIAYGGTLDQHITDNDGLVGHGVPGADGHGEMHDVTIEDGSRLAMAMGTTRVRCSSHHHQAVDTLGDDLVVVARAPDGIIEGIELADPEGPWVVGAQWHPEDTAADDSAQQSLFDTFVEQAAKFRS